MVNGNVLVAIGYLENGDIAPIAENQSNGQKERTMGIFDYINFEMPCPKCGNMIDGFQSKDRDCSLSTYNFWQVNHFHALCASCGKWIEVNRKNHVVPITDYEMTHYSITET